MSWQKIEEMPFVKLILRKAENEIETATGTGIHLRITAIEVNADKRKEIMRDAVCRYYGVSWAEVESTSKTKVIVKARHAYMYLMHKVYKYSKREVANDCGGRDHSTAVHAVKKINGYYDVNDEAVDDIEYIKKQLPIKLRK